MPTPAGTGLLARSFLLRSAGLALAVYGAGRLAGLPVFEAGIARAQAGRAAAPCWSACSWTAASTAVDARAGRRPALPPPAPDARAGAAAGSAVRRGPAAALASAAARRWPTLHAEGKVSVLPGGRLRPPGPVALRLAPLLGGRRAGRRSCAPAGSAACSTASARPTTRCRASRWTAASRRRWRPRAMPVAAVDAPEDFGFWTPGAWGAARRPRRARRSPTSAARCRLARPGGRAGRAARRRSPAACATRWRRSATTASRPTRPRAAYPKSARTRFPKRLAGFAAMLGAGLPIRAASVARPAPGTRTPTRPARCRENLKLTFDCAAGLPARPRGARARRPRADARVVGVRPPRAGERLGHRPRRGRHRLLDRHARRRADDRRVPGPGAARPGRQPARDVATSAASTRRCARTGSASIRPRCCPASRGIARPAVLR